MSDQKPMAFVDLQAQYQTHKSAIDEAIQKVLDHGRFIMGPEVGQLEQALGEFAGAKHVVSCSSGTDALMMIMMAEGIGRGDAIFVPSFTFTATAEVILLLGATPVFVDVDPSDFNLDVSDLKRQIERVRSEGEVVPKGILAVDLFGLPVDYAELEDIAAEFGLKVWADAAQSFGGAIGDVRVGALCRATATSFFPAKPLGCYGDGGAVFTDDDELAEIMKSIRVHGKGGAKYDIVRVGLNARIDTIQAAILLAKLPHFADEIVRREEVSQHYDEVLKEVVTTPLRYQGRSSAWAQYTIKVDPAKRDSIMSVLKEQGIPTAVYYPLPMHLQTAYESYGQGRGSLPHSESLSGQVMSLPMHPFLKEPEILTVATAIWEAVG